ncbi:MAG: ANTAR domain-containing protein [Phycisphaerales bacterium]|jgi:response regulator NasT|nr:ANTAR domain-containing protein [Phycisphaerales bacterium]
MDKQLRIIAAHGSDDTLLSIRRALGGAHTITGAFGTVAELRTAARSDRPDLIVTGVMFPDGSGIDACIELGAERPIPAVIVTARRSMELVYKAIRDHVMAYLIEPVTPEDLQASVIVAWARFEQLRDLQEQVGDLKQALSDRKIIERAKGVLMAIEEISEGEAFSRIRRAAQDQRTTMKAIAERILAGAVGGMQPRQSS